MALEQGLEPTRMLPGQGKAMRLLFCPVRHARNWWLDLQISLRSGCEKQTIKSITKCHSGNHS